MRHDRITLDPGITDAEPWPSIPELAHAAATGRMPARRFGRIADPLAPARGIALGTAIGCALWVLVFAGLAVLVALLTGGNR